MSEYESVIVERHGQVAVVSLNRPDSLNAFNKTMLRELLPAIEAVNADGNIRVAILTGVGRAFSAGADLSEDMDPDFRVEDQLNNEYKPILMAISEAPQPWISAVNGAAAGIGSAFAMACDLTLMAEDAYLYQAFTAIGLIPDGGATFLLPRLVGWGRAMELSLLAERLPAEKAESWGLVNRLFDDNAALQSGSMEIATKLANGPKSLALIRQAYWNTWHNAYEQQLDLEARLQNAAGRSADFSEGVTAFLEKRDAKFVGS